MAADKYNLFSFLRSASTQMHRKTAAVIVCAGNGTRFDEFGGITKQMAILRDVPVICRTIAVFEQCPVIDEIIVVARYNETGKYDGFIKQYGFKKIRRVVAGGNTRQQSALIGFDAISEDMEFVAIHDGARCLVTPEMIEKVALEAYRYGAATACTVSHDTVKLAGDNSFVDRTVDRDSVRLVQTPQIFGANLYRASAYTAKEDGVEVTDDCMLAERLGFRVRLVDCGADNIKITVPFDMYLAEAILTHRETGADEEGDAV